VSVLSRLLPRSSGTAGIAAAAAVATILGSPASSQTIGGWTQWGGPRRNFTIESPALAASWPAGGPRRLWSRALGEGHSSILADGGRLYTMYRPVGVLSRLRRSQQEAVVAMDASSGETIWEFAYAAPTAGLDFEYGAGPHATPLIVGDRLFAASTLKQIFAFDKTTGRQLWSHDLIREYGAPRPGRGFTCSPLAYRDTIIVTMGGPGQTVAAFDQRTGALAWKAGDFAAAPAAPILIDVDGTDQLVIFGGDDVVGLDPAGGRELWRHPHRTEWGLNISTPVWDAADHLLFVSSAYNTGSRGLEIRRVDGRTTVTERWFTNRMRVHIGSVIRIGDFAYGSSGDFGPAFITAVDLRSGRIAWQDRSFARAQLLHADGKLIVLDEDGTLGLATVTAQGLRVLARADVLDRVAWTPPTLAGTRLYARDRANVAAFELGR
jgi:outer membrane protein assembly factor BamB